jgi:protein SCO1/2
MPIRSVYLYFGVAVLVVAFGLGLRSFVFDDQTIARAGKQVDKGSSGRPAIGGRFTLVDHHGKTVTERDFLGRHMLVIFGYTNCPDICPLTLNTLTEVLDKMGGEAAKIRPVFVTVDPRRDSPAVIREYLKNFHPSFVGLTGTAQQVTAAKRTFRIYSQINHAGDEHTEDGGHKDNHKSDSDDYLVDHSSISYLMGPDGAFKTFVRHNAGADAMLAKLKKHL